MSLVMSLVCAVHPIRGKDELFLRHCRKERMDVGSERLPCWVAQHHLLFFFVVDFECVSHTSRKKEGKVLISSHRVNYAVGWPAHGSASTTDASNSDPSTPPDSDPGYVASGHCHCPPFRGPDPNLRIGRTRILDAVVRGGLGSRAGLRGTISGALGPHERLHVGDCGSGFGYGCDDGGDGGGSGTCDGVALLHWEKGVKSLVQVLDRRLRCWCWCQFGVVPV